MSLASYGARRSGSPLGGLVLLVVLGILGGLGVAIFLGLPRLSETWPPDGAAAVSSRASLRLTFSRPMNQASVLAGLTIAPDMPGEFAWQGSTLIFTPAFAWPDNAAVSVTLADARSDRGLPLLGQQTWSFSVGEPRLTYLAGDPPNLWAVGLAAGAEPQQLVDESLGIHDYAVSPDSTMVLYAARRADGGADLRLLPLDGTAIAPADWLLCPGQACVAPAFSPDTTARGGGRVAYQRHSLVAGLGGELTLGPAQVFVRGLSDGFDLLANEADARYPRWGPDGRLSYFDLGRSAIVVHDLGTGAVTYVPSASGEMAAWSSDAQSLFLSDIFFTAPPGEPDPAQAEESDRFYLNLLRVTVETNATQNISGGSNVDDSSAAVSPSGAWLAFGRKQFDAFQLTPGRQLWLMRPDGSDARALTADPLYNHSAFRWSPDGAAIAYMRFKVADPGDAAEIWIVEVQASGLPGAGGARRLVAGYLPEWLP